MSNANDFIIENGILNKNVGAFCGCSNLRSITMHPGVTIDRDYSGRKVGAETFGDCRSKKEVIFAKDCDDAVLDQFWEYFVVKSLHKSIKLDELNGYLEKAENAVTVKAYLLDYKEKQYSPKVQIKHETYAKENNIPFVAE